MRRDPGPRSPTGRPCEVPPLGRLLLLMMALAGLCASPHAAVAGDTAVDWDLCHFETADGSLRPVTSPTMAITACSSIIDSGLETGQNLANAYLYRADAHTKLDQTAAAFADYDQAATILPDADYVYVHRGQAYLTVKQTDRALEDFTKALTLKPDNANTLYLRGVTLVRLGQNERAIEDADRALALHPNDAAIRYLRCGARLRAGTALEGALEDCDAAIRSMPGDADMIELRAWLQLKLAHLPAAEADFTQVLALKPNAASALWGRHLERDRAGDQAGSTADLNAALTIDPRSVTSGARFGMAPAQPSTSPMLLIMLGVYLVFRLVIVTAAILSGARAPLGRGAYMVRALPLLLIGYVLTGATQGMLHGPVISVGALWPLLVGLVPDFLVTRLVIGRLIDIGTTRWRTIYWVAIPSVLGIMALVLCFLRSQPQDVEPDAPSPAAS